MNRRRVVRRIAGGVLLAVAVAGCSVPTAGTVTAQAPASDAPSTPAAAVPASSGACLLGANGADVEVGIGNPSDSCASWITNLAHIGLVWGEIPQMATPGDPGTADSETMSVRCDLSDGGGQELLVEDAGGALYGDSLCSQEEANGWTPQDGPLGQQANAAQASASAAAESAALASASASLAAQTVSDDQTLNGDVATLQGDIKTYGADLATAQADYQKTSGEPKCNSDGSPNTNTYDDAVTVYDDGGNVYDDESNLTNDISTVQGDVSTLGGDITTRPDAGTYAADITAANKVTAKAQSDVNAGESNTIQNQAGDIQTAVDNCGS